ncbi:MAG TPA: NnrU family protein [Aestuariivirga sp.]|nr:NnrU family protein [Aestuariivirga sp.]
MQALIAGILLFVLPHFVSSLFPVARDRLRLQWGGNGFRGAYALTVMAGVILMAWAYADSAANPPGPDFYTPPPGMTHATLTLVFLGFLALGASYGDSHIRLWLQNPMSIGVALWAVGHLLSNGERVQVMIFVAVLAVAVVDIVVSTARGKKPSYQPRWAADGIAVGIGIVGYLIMLFLFHPYILHVPVL